MAIFTQHQPRDEIDIGRFRGAISGPLFPGTSTIQARLR
jgi:hypothetical protein